MGCWAPLPAASSGATKRTPRKSSSRARTTLISGAGPESASAPHPVGSHCGLSDFPHDRVRSPAFSGIMGAASVAPSGVVCNTKPIFRDAHQSTFEQSLADG
jgi:hypothetical protein